MAAPSKQALRRFRDWQDAECVIEAVRVTAEKDSDGDTVHHADVVYWLERGERRLRIEERDPRKAGSPKQAAEKLRPGMRLACRYEPLRLDLATLDPASFPWGAVLGSLIPLSWLLIGLGGVWVHVPRGRFSAAAIPRELAVRLEGPPRSSPGVFDSWFGILFGLVWNGLLVPFVFSSPGMLPCLSLHLGAGALFTWAWARPVLQRLRLGDTVAELSVEKASPGETLRIKVVQAGSGPIDLLSVAVVCEEVATYMEGTDTRTERHEAERIEVGSIEFARVAPSRPLVIRGTCQLPPGAMGSFSAPHNSIDWFVRVDIKAPATPDREERFEFVVGEEA